jgi:hypothetical protein
LSIQELMELMLRGWRKDTDGLVKEDVHQGDGRGDEEKGEPIHSLRWVRANRREREGTWWKEKFTTWYQSHTSTI